MATNLSLTLNGVALTIPNPDPTMTLLDFIRTRTTLTGTKASCTQGGCGACVVLCTSKDAATGIAETHAVNACLALLCSLDGMSITTVEGLGNKTAGYTKVQTALAENGGTQCGFCTPGMVVAVTGLLLETEGKPTVAQCEGRIDGNLCRCTGYRPILDAVKSFATTSTPVDVEDLALGRGVVARAAGSPACSGTCGSCSQAHICHPSAAPRPASALVPRAPLAKTFESDQVTMYSPPDLSTLYSILTSLVTSKTPYRFVVGNTGSGVYPRELGSYQALVSLGAIGPLRAVDPLSSPDSVSFGGAVTLTTMISTFEGLAQSLPAGQAAFIPTFLLHAARIGSHNMRNWGTMAGNLAMAKIFGFASDLATLLVGLGAQVLVYIPSKATTSTMSLEQLFSSSVSPSDFLVCKITVPYCPPGSFYRTNKVALRLQNSHALVNASFVATYSGTTISSVRIVYGAVASAPVRAPLTEALLKGATISAATLASALSQLQEEISVAPVPAYATLAQPQGKLAYRKSLVPKFFYRFFLGLALECKVPLGAGVASGATTLTRGISSGTRTYKTDPTLYPVGQPIPKTGAILQASGEAVYVDDIANPRGGLYAAYVLAKAAGGKLLGLDASAAEVAVPGGVLITAAMIKGANDIGLVPGEEPLFAPIGAAIMYVGQPVGMFVAQTRALAEMGAALVGVSLDTPAAPLILTIDDAIAAKSFFSTDFQNQTVVWGDAAGAMAGAPNVATGKVVAGGQLHMYMEKQTCLAVPDEDGSMVLHASTQMPDDLRRAAANVLGVPGQSVTVQVRRVGGGYGGKLTRSFPPAAAVAVCAQYLNVPVRTQMEIHADMQFTGGRHPIQSSFTVGFADDASIIALQVTTYLNGGCTTDCTLGIAEALNEGLDSVYSVPNYNSQVIACRTSLPTNTASRSFGNIQASVLSESIIEAVAEKLGVEPEVVREKNFYNARNCVTPYGQGFADSFTLSTIWSQLKASADVEARAQAVQLHNSQSRWKKRGLAMTPVKYGVGWENTNAVVNISADGSVIILIGGVEMGQGVNVKVAQCAAQALGCPMDAIRIGDVSTSAIPSIKDSGGSVTSGENSEAVRRACLHLVEKALAPARATLPANSTWQAQVQAAYGLGLSLQATGYFYPPGRAGAGIGVDGQWKSPNNLFDYFIFGACVAETEVDVLTGEVIVRRVDLLYDCGNSMNPLVDMGQAEGAFVMGLGYLLTEEVLTDAKGKNNSDSTWEYKIPCSTSIPEDFRVAFLEDSPYLMGVMRSKAVGEPPMILSRACLSATRKAVLAARADRNVQDTIDYIAPFTVDRVAMECSVDCTKDLTLE